MATHSDQAWSNPIKHVEEEAICEEEDEEEIASKLDRFEAHEEK